MSGPQRVVIGAWLAMIGLATARTLGRGQGLPQPSVFLASSVLFSILYGGAAVVGPLAAVFAVGTDVAAVALPYWKGAPAGGGPLDTIAAGLQKLSGGTAPAPGGTLTP